MLGFTKIKRLSEEMRRKCESSPLAEVNKAEVRINVEKSSESEWPFPTVRVGRQLWMAEDLDVEVAEGQGQSWKTPSGRLYDWEAARALCPEGWRLPTDEDWVILECALGMKEREARLKVWGWRSSGRVGERLKCGGDSGLELSFGGCCDVNGKTWDQEKCGYWWTSTLVMENGAVVRGVDKSLAAVYRCYFRRNSGRSVRYVKA